MAWRSSQQAQHWEDVTGDMTEEKKDMTTRKIASFLVRIIFLNKEIGACEKNANEGDVIVSSVCLRTADFLRVM